MDRLHELETQRRSLAMLTKGQAALDREQASALVSELIELHQRLAAFQRELRAIMRAGIAPGANG